MAKFNTPYIVCPCCGKTGLVADMDLDEDYTYLDTGEKDYILNTKECRTIPGRKHFVWVIEPATEPVVLGLRARIAAVLARLEAML